jgi:hypothetical protein
MMLPIMPWCRIDRAYEASDVIIAPYRGRLDGIDDVVQKRGRRRGARLQPQEGKSSCLSGFFADRFATG